MQHFQLSHPCNVVSADGIPPAPGGHALGQLRARPAAFLLCKPGAPIGFWMLLLNRVSQSQPCPMQQRRSPEGTNNRSANQLTKQPVNEQFT
jgi:hypothetical protein